MFNLLFLVESARHSSGLGLTILRRIAELHGGEVRIANAPDEVVVELFLPKSVLSAQDHPYIGVHPPKAVEVDYVDGGPDEP